MARPKKKNPKTNAERQAEYRARKKAQGLKRQDEWVDPKAPARKPVDQERERRKVAWLEEERAEELKAVRKAARQGEQDKYKRRGYLSAMLQVAHFLIKKGKGELTQVMLENFYISRDEFCKNGFKDYDLKILDKMDVYYKPD
jgi:hypothetical protein